jgi:hypothetical protein
MPEHENNFAGTILRCTPLVKVDLHVHVSGRNTNPLPTTNRKNSEIVSTVKSMFLQARSRGMTFVTLTEHNSIECSLMMKDLWPDDAFTGVEVTTLFPEDGGRAHLLVYGLKEAEFEEIQLIRNNIYALRDFVEEKRIACSVAHAVHSLETKDLKVEHLEKLLLLFDVFEVINGGCSYGSNHVWANLLRSLTPDYIERLVKKHRIRPISEDPWIKGVTAGSDDHAEGAIGNIYTVSPARSANEFMEYLQSKLTFVGESYRAMPRGCEHVMASKTDIKTDSHTEAA